MRILFVCSNPTWTERLDLGDEMREILSSLKGQDVKFKLLPAAQRMDLKTAIASNDIDILHFSGHASKEEGIILRDEDGMEDPVAGTELHELLDNADRPITLTVLNACNTQSTAKAIAKSVGAVISTTNALEDAAAKKMTRVLYTELCAGRSIESSCNTARQFVAETAPEEDVYELTGADDARRAELFEKPTAAALAGDAEIDIEGKTTYDKYFFIDYLDTQIESITRRIRRNQNLFKYLFGLGIAFLLLILFQPNGVAAKFVDFILYVVIGAERSNAIIDHYAGIPYLDSLIAVGAAIPVLISFLQSRLILHGNTELTSLQQMKELAKASDELPSELQQRLQKILDQCIRGADTEEPPGGWFDFLKVLQNPTDSPQESGP